jgi:hypothetical protein
MARLMPVLLSVLLLVIAGASGALAQANCQPTLTQPCAKPQAKAAGDQSPQRPAAKADEEPIDHSKRIRIDKDTDFNFSFGGLGLKQKF